jgi:hypothetical protein
MSLPGSYQYRFHFPEPEDIDQQSFIQDIEDYLEKENQVKEIAASEESFQFSYQSLFGITYQIEIDFKEIDSKTINYEIKLNKLIMVSIALILFIAFFSSFQFSGFLWFSGIFTIIFYSINVIVVDKFVQGVLKSALNTKEIDFNNDETLRKQQMEWIRDNSKCPACGEEITEYDKNCPECGLKIRETAKPKPYDLSKYENKNVKYHFREKKK